MLKLLWKKQATAFEKQNIQPIVKHCGDGAMIWVCMAASGDSQLTFIDSTLDHMGYLNTLKENLKQSAQDLNNGYNFWFQRDNGPKHTPYNLKLWLLYSIKNQLHTLLQSPDVNSIEHLCDLLECKIWQH